MSKDREELIIINGEETLILSSLLADRPEGGKYPKDCYQDTQDTNGIYQVDNTKYIKYLEKKQYESTKTLLNSLQIFVNQVNFDADSNSVNMMNAVGTLANWNMFKAMLTSGVVAQELYDSVYKQTVPWRNAENEISQVQIETILEALEVSMRERANVYTGQEVV